jgi:hypothetical protein
VSRKATLMLAVLGLLGLLAGCRGDPTTVMTRLEESRRLVATLRLDFQQMADASNRAVMANSEEASAAAARDSQAATSAVEKDAAKLAELLQGLSYANEAGVLSEFKARFSEYKALDTRIVNLAVENTNLKAQALAFGPASEAAGVFAASLDAARSRLPSKALDRAELLITQALLAVREIQVLHAPHIAERDEATMARMEKQMLELDAKARTALTALTSLASEEARPSLTDALAALDRFKATSAQIIELSRRNTNVLALDLSLRQKPALVAACNRPLVALQAALALEGPKSSR